jgi:hypothetical protein
MVRRAWLQLHLRVAQSLLFVCVRVSVLRM